MVHFQDALRSQVETELNMANDKIEAITKQIDTRELVLPLLIVYCGSNTSPRISESSQGKKKGNAPATAINGKRKFAGQGPGGGNKVKEESSDRGKCRTTAP